MTIGLGVAGGQILAFPIDIDRRPYNTRITVRVCDDIIYAHTPAVNHQSSEAIFFFRLLKILPTSLHSVNFLT